MSPRNDEQERDPQHDTEARPEPAIGQAFGRVTGVLMTALFAVLVYRAATQAITYDEALSWRSHIGGPHALPWGSGVNNHILFTQLARLSVWAFGVSEWSLRLPSLLAALLFLRATWLLCRGSFSSRATLAVALALVVLNPYVLDYFAAARGYGLGIAFVVWAFADLVAWTSDRRPVRLLRAGAAAGLTVAAQLTFAPFVLALVGALAAWELCVGPAARGEAPAVDGEPERSPRAGLAARLRRTAGTLVLFGLAGILAGVPLVAILMRELVVNFFGGVDNLAATAAQLADRSLVNVRAEFVPGGRAPWVSELLEFASTWVLPALFLLVVVAWLRLARRALRREGPNFSRSERLLFLAGGVAWLAPVVLTGMVWGLPLLGKEFVYPGARRAVWYLPVFALGVSALADAALAGPEHWRRWGGRVLLCVLLLGAGRFAYQLEVSYFYDWRYDAGSRRIFDAIEEHRLAHAAGDAGDAGDDGRGRVRVGVSPWLYECSLNYYQELEAPDWMWPIAPALERGLDYDYLVLDPALDPELAGQRAEVLFQDPVSRVWLLAPHPRTDPTD